jgi:hypothetical protein
MSVLRGLPNRECSGERSLGVSKLWRVYDIAPGHEQL